LLRRLRWISLDPRSLRPRLKKQKKKKLEKGEIYLNKAHIGSFRESLSEYYLIFKSRKKINK
jgi:hypothetical protein